MQIWVPNTGLVMTCISFWDTRRNLIFPGGDAYHLYTAIGRLLLTYACGLPSCRGENMQ